MVCVCVCVQGVWSKDHEARLDGVHCDGQVKTPELKELLDI